MRQTIPVETVIPPPGYPSWTGSEDLPLIYLGWGQRDFTRHPLPVHYDRGTRYCILLRGEITITTGTLKKSVEAPTALLFDPNCAFGISQTRPLETEVIVWIWNGRPNLQEVLPPPGGALILELKQDHVQPLVDLHVRCRNEVSRSDGFLHQTLIAVRDLLDVEILRTSREAPFSGDSRWPSANHWMMNNLASHTPVPALCDYLCMSPSTLYRFFREQVGMSPGVCFRELKIKEARRLIQQEGWQVKAAAYHLGYRHPNDLSRALSKNSSIASCQVIGHNSISQNRSADPGDLHGESSVIAN